MHLTLKKETTKPAGENILHQKARFDEFREEFNNYRPHEGIKMKYPFMIKQFLLNSKVHNVEDAFCTDLKMVGLEGLEPPTNRL